MVLRAGDGLIGASSFSKFYTRPRSHLELLAGTAFERFHRADATTFIVAIAVAVVRPATAAGMRTNLMAVLNF